MNQNAIRQAILALKNGKINEARTILVPIIKDDPANEQAWLVFVTTFESDQEKIEILQRFLKINPSSINGAHLLIQLKDRIHAAEEAQAASQAPEQENEFSSLVDELRENTNELKPYGNTYGSDQIQDDTDPFATLGATDPLNNIFNDQDSTSGDSLFEQRGDTSDLPSFFASDGTGILDEVTTPYSSPNTQDHQELEPANEEDIFAALEGMSDDSDLGGFDIPEIDFEALVKDATGELNLDEFDSEEEDMTDPFDLNINFLSEDDYQTKKEKEFDLDSQDDLNFDDINLESALLGYTDDTDELFPSEEVPNLSSIEKKKEKEEKEPPSAIFLDYEDELFDEPEPVITQPEPEATIEPDIREELTQEDNKKKKKKNKDKNKNDKKQNKKLRRRVFTMIWIVAIIGVYQFLYLPGKLDPYIDPLMAQYVTPFYEANIKPFYDKNIRPYIPFDLAVEEQTDQQDQTDQNGVDLPPAPTPTVITSKPVTLNNMAGQVNTRIDDTKEWQPLNTVQPVIMNGQIQTAMDASIELLFNDNTNILLSDETTLNILDNTEESISLELITGQLYIQNAGTDLNIESTVANINVKQGTVLFLIDPSLKFGEVDCFTGNCSVKVGATNSNIGSGMAYVIQSAQTPGAIQPIQENALRTWMQLDETVFEQFATYPNAIIGGTAWNDISMDGVQDPGESVFANLDLQLVDNQGNIVSVTKSDKNGHYLFSQPEAGYYYLAANIPNAMYSSPTGNENIIDPLTNESAILYLGEDQQNELSLNIGLMTSRNSTINTTTHRVLPTLPVLAYNTETKSTGLVDDDVTSLYAGKNDTLWAATARGLSLYQNNTWTTYRINNGLVNETIYAVVEDGYGKTYVLSQGNALAVFDGQNWTSVLLPDSIQFDLTTPSASFPLLTSNAKGKIWMALEDTLYQYDGTQWISYRDFENAMIKDITALTLDSHNVVWLGHWGGGVSRFDGTTWTFFTTQDGLLSDNINAIVLDPNQAPLIATSAGLMRYTADTWTPVYQGLTEDLGTISSLFLITTGTGAQTQETLWVGTNQGAYLLEDGIQTETETIPGAILESIEDIAVSDITQTTDGVLWFATDLGLIRQGGGQWVNYPNANSPSVRAYVDLDRKGQNDLVLFTQNQLFEIDPQDAWLENSLSSVDGTVKQVAVDSLDRIWLMTDKNLAMLSSTQTTTLDYPEQWFDSNSTYTEFIITDKNTTWIATDNFVASQNGFGWAVYDHNNGIPTAPITDIYVDDRITVVTTNGGGASILENGTWRFLHQGNGLSTNALSSVTVDQDGTIWFGTFQAGLISYDGQNFTTYTTEDGLLNYQITNLATGDDNVVWVGTILGLNAIADGKIYAYTTQDGLSANSIKNILPMADGSVWVTTTSNTMSHLIP
jgi:ligand-binding sensor domain-containing protein